MRLQRLQRGFSIVTAIFLIVILAALGTYMVYLSSVQHETTALTVQSARAYQAARSGVEWGLNQVLRPVPAPACFGAASFPLQGFTVNVTCDLDPVGGPDHPEGGVTLRVYRVSATASFGSLGEPTFVQRSIEIVTNRTVP